MLLSIKKSLLVCSVALLNSVCFDCGLALSRSVGTVQSEQDKSTDATANIPMRLWTNQKFTVLDSSRSLQRFGYQNLHDTSDRLKSVSYAELAGKTLVVTGVNSNNFGEYVITFEEQQSKKTYTSDASYRQSLDHVVLSRDLEDAKARWIGKDVYSKSKRIYMYDQDTDKFGSVRIGFGQRLKVIDVCTGFYQHEPLWLIVQTDQGVQGYIGFAYSWTNMDNYEWRDYQPWEKRFFESNPRDIYDWSEEVWSSISNSQIMIGMDREQVVFSWGDPKKINKDIYYDGSTREQWVYSSGYVYFDGGIVVAAQSR